ncbi:hypothetical protein MRX96_014351 [Rhipicephalus microplus]
MLGEQNPLSKQSGEDETRHSAHSSPRRHRARRVTQETHDVNLDSRLQKTARCNQKKQHCFSLRVACRQAAGRGSAGGPTSQAKQTVRPKRRGNNFMFVAASARKAAVNRCAQVFPSSRAGRLRVAPDDLPGTLGGSGKTSRSLRVPAKYTSNPRSPRRQSKAAGFEFGKFAYTAGSSSIVFRDRQRNHLLMRRVRKIRVPEFRDAQPLADALEN